MDGNPSFQQIRLWMAGDICDVYYKQLFRYCMLNIGTFWGLAQSIYWKHFWLDESRKEDFFEIFPEYEDLRYIKGLGCKSFHGVQETWDDIYMDHLIRLSRGLDRYREPPENNIQSAAIRATC